MSEAALHQIKSEQTEAKAIKSGSPKYRPVPRQSKSNHELSTTIAFETEETVFDFYDTPGENLLQTQLNDSNKYEDEENDLMNNTEKNEEDDDDDQTGEEEETFERIIIGVCAMAKKVQSKPMEAILSRLESYDHFDIIVFEQSTILDLPIEEWPKCDCFLSFYSKDFPLKKAQDYAALYNPYLINDLEKQWDIMDRTKVYETLAEAGIEQPIYAIKRQDDNIQIIEQDDQIEIGGQVFTKPFVEKPINADDHNIYIYFPSSAGGGSQRLFRKVGTKSSVYSHETKIRRKGSYIYEQFMPTDGTDVKIYTVGPEYAHAEARKSPALDGVVERDENGKEVRYPIMLRAEEKIIANKIVKAFKQAVCGFDLLRANGKSYVCDVNGFSFVKNSHKYYDDCSSILAHSILKEIAPQRHIPYMPISYQAEDRPIVPTTFGTMMELRCVIGVMRHGDRTPKQKMKMEIRNSMFMDLFNKYDGMKNGSLKLKRPSQLQEVLDIARKLYKECIDLNRETLPSKETKTKLLQLKSVLEMYGHFSGINRKVQLKYQPQGKHSSSNDEAGKCDSCDHHRPYLLLILKWGGELTTDGKVQAEDLGTAFRKLYPGGEGSKSDAGFLRLHSTYRHDLKIYASDEGRVQTTAAAFAKGLLALDGELAPIMVQMVKSANTNGLLDNESMSARLQDAAKSKLQSYLSVDKDLDDTDKEKIDPNNNYSLQSSLEFIKNPVSVCKRVYGYIKELNNLIRNKITDNKYYDLKLYHDESWELMLRRWLKLEKDFYNKKLERFEISKIPDIYDSVKYDLMHNRSILNFENAFNLYSCTKALADCVVPQEYGITKEEKLRIAQGIVTPLLKKIRADLKCNLTGIWESDQQINDYANQLDPSYSKGIHTPGRHVRTRLYFTSESHIYSLLTVLKFGNLFEDGVDEQWSNAINFLDRIPELNYLTQIVIMLYEDPNVDTNSDKRFHVELHFSSGAYADFDAPAYVIKAPTPPDIETTNASDPEQNSSGSESRGMSASTSPNPKYKVINSYLTKVTDKRLALKNLPKRFPQKKQFTETLKTLPEPNECPMFDLDAENVFQNNVNELKINLELKPRSFDDEHRRINSIKKQPYNHYNTFHGSGSLNDYHSLSQIFKTKNLTGGTNSSPDLNNQNVLVRCKKSLSTIYQELIKVRYMRPLETLHNNLCFKNLNNFLTRMIYDRHSPHETTILTKSTSYTNQLSNGSDLIQKEASALVKVDERKEEIEIKACEI